MPWVALQHGSMPIQALGVPHIPRYLCPFYWPDGVGTQNPALQTDPATQSTLVFAQGKAHFP
jgi:hypothetical protein